MPYTVQQLFDDRESLISPTGITQTASLQDALNLMHKKQYSQLPIIDEENRLVGERIAYMVTNETILDALSNLGISPKKLRVSDAMVRVRPYRLEDQLSDLLQELRDTNAVPIMAEKRVLVGVVTSYDTTEYFRRHAEDMMLIEQIEKKIKAYITLYFTNPNGVIDYSARQTAVADSIPSNKDLRGPFKKAVKHYLSLQAEQQLQINDALSQQAHGQINDDFARQAFDKYLYHKDVPDFDRLSLDDYIRIFVHKSRWNRYENVFRIDSEAMEDLLKAVRNTRNDFAHFRIETIADEERRKIQYCNNWLESLDEALMREFKQGISVPESFPSVMEPLEEVSPAIVIDSKKEASIEVIYLAEETPSDSRYAPLAVWLQERLPGEQAVQLTFQQIEAIIGDTLPPSAHERFWWANNTTTRVQSQQWLEVGWRVSKMDMSEETVVFSRIKEREKLYIDFFGALLSSLKTSVPFPVRQSSPDGFNWIIVTRLPQKAPQTAFLGVSFARRSRFRVELYIDTGDKTRNKAIYDALYHRKATIQNELASISGSLEWERINDKRASRIALYRGGAIGENEDKLAELRTWAVNAMLRFQPVMEHHVSEVIHDL